MCTIDEQPYQATVTVRDMTHRLHEISELCVTVSGIGCQNGWIRFEGSCYLYNSKARTFSHASVSHYVEQCSVRH